MIPFKADFHNHTLLSPCGDIEMTPMFIISSAMKMGYDIIGITDHNSTLQGREMKRIVGDGEPFILCGAEITSREEVHCLVFVDGEKNLTLLQEYIDTYLPKIKNDVDVFGYQLLVNENEEILAEQDYLLISGLSQSIDQIADFVYSLDGIFILAHIDKKQNSIVSQLGFIPFDLKFDAVEFSKHCDVGEYLESNKYISKFNTSYIQSSDAHYPDDFGVVSTLFNMERRSFQEIKMALHGEKGRYVEIR